MKVLVLLAIVVILVPIAVVSQTTIYWKMDHIQDANGVTIAEATPEPSDHAAPSTPTSLTCSGTTGSSVSLSWGASTDSGSAGMAGYRVYRGSLLVGVVSGTTFAGDVLQPSTGYTYKVAAFDNKDNQSSFSSTATCTTAALPGTPSGLSASRASDSQINLSWTDNSSNETGFRIERKIGSTGSWTLVTSSVGANATSYSDTSLDPATVYTYRVRALNATVGDSAYSSAAEGCTCTSIASTGKYDGANSEIAYTGGTWTDDVCGLSYSGTMKYANATGATATFSFSGDSITWWLILSSNFGIVNVTVDGINKGNIDLYSPYVIWQTGRTYRGLGSGHHTIRISNTGTRNVASSDNFLDIDSLEVNLSGVGAGTYDDDANADFIGTWNHATSRPVDYGGAMTYSSDWSHLLTFTFTGSKVTYQYELESNRGIATVSIDGVPYPLIDQYAPTTETQIGSSTYSSLGNGVHVLTISVSGAKNGASSNYYISADRFDVSN